MKTKFKISQLFNMLLVLFGIVVIIIFTNKIFIKISIRGFKISDFSILFLFFILIWIGIRHLNSIKYIIIDKQKLKYYSILSPFGKILYLRDFIGLLQITETGTSGNYKSLYFIDDNYITRFKILGIYYINMDEIVKEISLPIINQSLSPLQYFKLLFIGKINLSKSNTKKDSELKINKILNFFIFGILLVFVITMVLKILLRNGE